LPEVLGAVILGVVLVLVVWDPVFPSSWILRRMADSVDPERLSLDRPVVLRFELSGKGGGIYNLLVDRDKVEVATGMTDHVDLILYMEAEDFNNLILSLAGGRADEYTFRGLIISKTLTFSGDLAVFQKVFGQQRSAT